ncbi:hypothetical protein BpHYR1_047759 [Brachionus plicatilis]|uniref:Uncharacterized protein n=1 Tax=Brachionus plicatilis TaxID=10195 RepID=A0A3M7T8T3_BRAPC|nr:hypothetical protein BpHYR1_047759 [Brachionus plicatilis]
MGAIKSKIFDDSTTLDHESLKPGEMTKMRQDDEDMSLPSAQYVTNEPERIANTSIDQIHEKISAINLDSEKKESFKSRMQSASAASFQPPDFLQRSQYFRSFRSASRRFFGKKDHTDVSISKISKENEPSTGNNIPNRNYFYRSFKNLNRNNLNCISNLNNDRENIKGQVQPPPEMKNSWFKNLKSRSNADFEANKNSSNFKKSSSREPIVEESPKFPSNKNLTSRSFNTIPTLGLSLVEIDTDEPKVQVKSKAEPRPEMTSESSNSSSSSAGMFSRQSNGLGNNSRSFDQFRKTVQIPIKIVTDQQSVKQKHQANYINSVFLNELNTLDGLAQKNDFLVDRLKSEVENLNRLLDVFNREDPKVINELIFKTDDLSNQALKFQAEVQEQLKIKNKNSQMNRFTSEVVIKLYEECIIRLDRQLEILISQISELTSIKNFLDQVASDYNQQSQQSSSSSYGYSDSYYSSSSSDGYYPNYQNYHSRNNFYYNPRSSQ